MNWKDLFPRENRYYETKNGILYCGDCLEIITEFPEESIDLVLTDPPYNASNSKLGFADGHYVTINKKWDKNFKPFFFDHCANLLKPGGQILAFYSYHLLGEYLQKNNRQIILKSKQHF